MLNFNCMFFTQIHKVPANISYRDYKKLTFYFYAEQYINFNDLVTELFKIWKLRIWLSAVNPASYPEQKTRGRGHRLRGEASLGASASPGGSDSHESGFGYQVLSPPSTASMPHNPYTNVGQSGYGSPFSNAGAFHHHSQHSSFGNAFPSTGENPVMNTYFGATAPPSGMSSPPQQWGPFGNHPGSDFMSATGPGSSAHPSQSLAGFAGATPFVPGRSSGFGPSGPEISRNIPSKGRPMSASSLTTLSDEAGGRFYVLL
jgi:PSP1 C-terminal conserved region